MQKLKWEEDGNKIARRTFLAMTLLRVNAISIIYYSKVNNKIEIAFVYECLRALRCLLL